jgi:hypothetical protein
MSTSTLSPRSSGTSFDYYPTTADALQTAILSQGDFSSLSEVSRFASAMVKLVARQALEIQELRRDLERVQSVLP